MIKKQYSSLADLRADKLALKKHMKSDVDNLKADVKDCFLPRDPAFLNSSNKYMNYVGYAITAFKTMNAISGVFKIFRKRR